MNPRQRYLARNATFGSAFSDAQIDQIVKYIRELKPREG